MSIPENEREDILCSYKTPYVLWANDAAADTLNWNEAVAALDLPEDGVLSASFLGSVLLDLTGRAGSGPRERKAVPARRSRRSVDPLSLHPGDLVVHAQHGIGRFVELMRRSVGSARRKSVVRLSLLPPADRAGGAEENLYSGGRLRTAAANFERADG